MTPQVSETAPSTTRCPVTGNDQCRVMLCVNYGCYLRRLGYPSREPTNA